MVRQVIVFVGVVVGCIVAVRHVTQQCVDGMVVAVRSDWRRAMALVSALEEAQPKVKMLEELEAKVQPP